jgi:hypothetical protein
MKVFVLRNNDHTEIRTNELQFGLWYLGRVGHVSVKEICRQVKSLPMKPVDFAHFNQPIKKNSPHSRT